MKKFGARRMMLCAVGAMSMLLGSQPIFAQAGGNDDQVILRSYYGANGFLNRGLYDLAAEEYRAFLAAHPNHEKAPDARYGLGVSLFRQQLFAEAITELTPLTNQAGFRYGAEVLMVLGQSHLSLGQNGEADVILGTLVERYADHDLADDGAALQTEARYRNANYAASRSVAGLFESRWPDSPMRERVALFEALSSVALGDDNAAITQLQNHLNKYPEGSFRDQVTLLLAQANHRIGETAKASNQYQQVIQSRNPTYTPDAMYGMALLLHQQGDQQQAGRLLDELLETYENHELQETALLLRGRTYFEERDFDQAVQRYTEAYNLNRANQDEATYWLAKCELRQNKPGDAAARLEAAIVTYEKSDLLPEMHYDLGVAKLRNADEPGAIAALEDYRARFGDHELDPDALHLLAGINHQRREYDESLNRTTEFLNLYPDHTLAPAVAFLVGENEYLAGRFEEATSAYAKFREGYPNDSRIQKASYRQGMSLYQLQRYDEAEPYLTQAMDRENAAAEFPLAALALGDSYFQQKRWDESVQMLQSYLDQSTDPAALASADDALLKLGMSYQRIERYDPALDAFGALISSFPNSPLMMQAVFESGQALVAVDRLAEAEQSFRQVLEQSDDERLTVYASNHLGAIAFREKRFDEAADHYDRVATLAGDDQELAGEAIFQRGRALMAAADYADAAQAFATIISGFDSHTRQSESLALQAISLARADQHEQSLALVARVNELPEGAINNTLRSTMWYEQAWALRELERDDEAMATYEQILADSLTASIRAHAVVELAEMHATRDDHERASELLTPFIAGSDTTEEISPALVQQARYQLGVSEYQQEHYDPAVQILEEFIDGEAEARLMASAHLICGESLYHLGSHDKAITHLTSVVDNYSDDETFGPSLLRLGECQALLQRWDSSRDSFERFLNDLPDDPQWFQAQFGVAWATENQGDLDGAITGYRRVVDNHAGPTAARAQFQVGECLFAKKQYDVAARELLKVDILYAYPQWSAAALYEAARCFQAMNDPVKAREHFRLVMDTYENTEWASLASKRMEEMARTTLPGRSGGGSSGG